MQNCSASGNRCRDTSLQPRVEVSTSKHGNKGCAFWWINNRLNRVRAWLTRNSSRASASSQEISSRPGRFCEKARDSAAQGEATGCGDGKGKNGEQTQLCESLRSGARGDAAVPKLCLAVNCVAGRKSGWWHEVRGTSAFPGGQSRLTLRCRKRGITSSGGKL